MSLMYEENSLLLHISRRRSSCINMSRYLGRQALNITIDTSLSFCFFRGKEQARPNWRSYNQPKSLSIIMA